MGNWHLNQGETQAALDRHREALGIFQDLADNAGQAETFDLLGMTSYLSGDLRHGTAYYEQAVGLFRELDDRTGLTSSLTTLMLRSANPMSDTMRGRACWPGEEAAVARGMATAPAKLRAGGAVAVPRGAAPANAGRSGRRRRRPWPSQWWQTCAQLGAVDYALATPPPQPNAGGAPGRRHSIQLLALRGGWLADLPSRGRWPRITCWSRCGCQTSRRAG
jgi:hypothetical protein